MRSMPSSPSASLVSQSRWPCTVKPRGTTIWKSASHVVFVDGTMTPIRFLVAITPSLEPVLLVDLVPQLLPREQAARVVRDDLEAPLVEIRAVARDVRCQQHAGHRPQRMSGGG